MNISHCGIGSPTSERIAMAHVHEYHQPSDQSIGECVQQDNDCQTLGIRRNHGSVRYGFVQSIRNRLIDSDDREPNE